MDAVIDGQVVPLGESLGSGGFGRVYEATINGASAVVKLVPKDPGAHRELLLAGDVGNVPNIVPVLGVGEAGNDHWAIAMRRAQQSLRDFLVNLERPLEPAEAIPILIDVAQALVSLESVSIVHRDLKPENLLFFEGRWCLTDFGISRYAEATTAIDTRKEARTKQYAAPEQWREERATSATDVYALGVIAYELLTGSRPFNGPDFRRQHLEESPLSLTSEVDTPLRNIVDECLYKGPQARPRPRRLLERLQVQSTAEAPEGGAAALVQANQRLVAETSERQRQESVARVEHERRLGLLDAAISSYTRISNKLLDVVIAHTSIEARTWPIRLGNAELSLTTSARLSLHAADTQNGSGRNLPFDVITYAEIVIDQSRVQGGGTGNYCGRRHSLWYCNAQDPNDYAWFETAFMENVMITSRRGFRTSDSYYPLAFGPDDMNAREALMAGVTAHQVAWPFTALRDDQLTEFVDRWATYLAQAQAGTLRMPTMRPEKSSHGTFRAIH